MKKVICIVAVMFLAGMVIGCASTSSTQFGMDTTSGLTGKTQEQIITQFGQPYKKFTTSDGDMVLEYRQATKQGSAINTAAAISSFGLFSGKNNLYVDIMKIYFKEGVVQKSTFEENVLGVTTPGM